MEFEVSKSHILRPTLFIDMVLWVSLWKKQNRCYGKKKMGPMVENHCYDNLLMKLFMGKRIRVREDKRMVNLFSFPFLSQSILHFLDT